MLSCDAQALLCRQVRTRCFQNLFERPLVLRPEGCRREPGIGSKIGKSKTFACPPKQVVVAGGHDEVSVLAAKRLVGRVARVRRAELARVLAAAEVLTGLQGGDRQRGAEHG